MSKPLLVLSLAALLAACSSDADTGNTPSLVSTDSSAAAAPQDPPSEADSLLVPLARDGAENEERPGSCSVQPTEPLCYAFTGPGWTSASAETECSGAIGGTYSSAACPTAERIGECVYRPGGDADRELVYTFYAPQDPMIAEGICPGTYRAF